MEIKYKARVAAKPWPAQSDASGHSPCGHHAHPTWAQHGPEELGNGSNWASSLQHWTHRALPGPFGLCRARGTTRAHKFLGGQGSSYSFFWQQEQQLFRIIKLFELEKTFKTKIFQDYQVHKTSSAKATSFWTQSMGWQLSSNPRCSKTAAKGCQSLVSATELPPLQKKTCPMMKRKGWLIYLDILCTLMKLQNEYQLG